MKHNTMKVGDKVREIPNEFGWKMKEGVGIGDGGIYIYFIEQLENV